MARYVTSTPAEYAKAWETYDPDRAKAVADLWGEAHGDLLRLQGFQSAMRSEGASTGDFYQAFQAKIRDANTNDLPKLPDYADRKKKAEEDFSDAAHKVRKLVAEMADRTRRFIEASEESAEKTIKENANLKDEQKEEAREQLDKDVAIAWRAVTLRKLYYAYKLKALEGTGVFCALKDYEGRCLTNALTAVRYGNITGGLAEYRARMDNKANLLPAQPDMTGVPAAQVPPTETRGLIYWALMMLNGLCWLVTQHWVFAIFFLAGALAIWALFGGAIHRIAALHFGRDQKISIGQALRFSASKFLSFYFAPLIPLAIIVVIGFFLFAGGLVLGSWLGFLDAGIIMSLLVPLAIGGGLLIAFLLIGLGAGGSLMYPTIAVESSDSFDAIGRSYSYVYGRPWRAGFYCLVATFYGAICYIFVRFCAFLALASTHAFVKMGVYTGGQSVSPVADGLDTVWTAPTFDNLISAAPRAAMGGGEAISAWLIWLWTMLVAVTVLAFALSFCSSAKTVIYFLLRRRIDATDLDDVYVDEPAEEFGPEPTEEPAAPAEPAPAAEEKPETGEAEDKKEE